VLVASFPALASLALLVKTVLPLTFWRDRFAYADVIRMRIEAPCIMASQRPSSPRGETWVEAVACKGFKPLSLLAPDPGGHRNQCVSQGGIRGIITSPGIRIQDSSACETLGR
jgi:hypothetical protein